MISRCAGQGCWVRVVGFRVIRVVGFRVVRVVGFRVVGLGLLGQACGVRVRGDLAWIQRGRCVQNLGFSLEFRVGLDFCLTIYKHYNSHLRNLVVTKRALKCLERPDSKPKDLNKLQVLKLLKELKCSRCTNSRKCSKVLKSA